MDENLQWEPSHSESIFLSSLGNQVVAVTPTSPHSILSSLSSTSISVSSPSGTPVSSKSHSLLLTPSGQNIFLTTLPHVTAPVPDERKQPQLFSPVTNLSPRNVSSSASEIFSEKNRETHPNELACIPCEPVPYYGAQYKEPALVMVHSMESFPPLPPVRPVPADIVKIMLDEFDAVTGSNDPELEKLRKEFKMTQPTLLSFKLEWTFGINRHVPFVNLCTDNQRSIFYASGLTGVVYSFEQNGLPIEPVQILLEGLDRHISCIATTKNGRWLAAGDMGQGYSAIVWDLQQDAIPMRVYSTPNGKEAYGLVSLCFSPSMQFLAMLSAGEHQVLTLYEWLVDRNTASDEDAPVVCFQLPETETLQSQLSFHPTEQDILMSCSKDHVILYQWHALQTKGQVRICIPNTKKIPSSDVIGLITRSAFIPGSTHLVVGTNKGQLVLLRKRTSYKKILPFEEYTEIVKVYTGVENGAVTAISCLNGMIAVGDSQGSIKFYDPNLLILFTCNNINLGAVESISFSKMKIHKELTTQFDKKALFVSDFLIGTDSGYIAHIRTTGNDQYKTCVVREEPRDAVISCAAHPNAHRLVIGSCCGLLRIYDYKRKTILVQRQLNKQGCGDENYVDITTVAFDPTGVYLGCGLASGEVRILRALDLSDEPKATFCDSIGKIIFMEFSNDALMMATADDEGIVSLYRNGTSEWSPSWTFVGCHQAHNGPVLNLFFVKEYDGEKERLFSLGLDSCFVEYDLENSGHGDLFIIYRELADQEAQTFSAGFYSPPTKENFLITSNDKYKLKLWNVTTKTCRKTINGPLQGSPVMGMVMLPSKEPRANRYILWRNADSIGLMALPLDGNPYRYCSRRVHPLGVTCMKPSANGRFVFTAGGPEGCVHMWSVHPEVLESSLEGRKDSLMPFFDLLEGGMDGKMYHNLEETFCYLQLKVQGFETREARVVRDRLSLQELPNFFCALSYYPSEREKKDIITEIKYSMYAECGILVDEVDVGTALKTFVNHRPIWGIQYPDIIKAFAKFGFEELRTTVRPAQLVQILKGIGESMTEDEAVRTLGVLMNLRPPLGDWETVGAERDLYNSKMTLPKEMTVQQIIEEVLGFCTKEAFYFERPVHKSK